MNEQEFLSLPELLTSLRDESEPLPTATEYRLSSLPPDDVATLADAWPELPVARRMQLLARLNAASEANFELDFSSVEELALDDEDEYVRCLAIAGLWEVETPSLLGRLTSILTDDSSTAAREKAASDLGRFVLLGELGKMPAEVVNPTEKSLLDIHRNPAEPLDIRRRALESLSYSGRQEVSGLIEDAYYHDDISMKASALFSMGRSCDNRWAAYVLDELVNTDDEIRYEAARAAGELELTEAVPLLASLLDGHDIEVRAAVIWSLGEIGGPEARRALNHAADLPENENLLDDLEDALAAAALAEGTFSLMAFSEDEDSGSAIVH